MLGWRGDVEGAGARSGPGLGFLFHFETREGLVVTQLHCELGQATSLLGASVSPQKPFSLNHREEKSHWVHKKACSSAKPV